MDRKGSAATVKGLREGYGTVTAAGVAGLRWRG